MPTTPPSPCPSTCSTSNTSAPSNRRRPKDATILKVIAEKKIRKTKRYIGGGEEHYWRYWAVYDDGSKVVIRKTATRAYLNAYRYDHDIASGPKAGTLPACFTFGKNPSSYGNTPIATYVIEYEVEIIPGFYRVECSGDCPPRETRVFTEESGAADYAGGCNQCGAPHTWTRLEKVTFHVEVHTYGDGQVDGQPVWTGNQVNHETFEAAEEAAKDLFGRWTAVKFWRVIDSNGVFRAGNQGDAS